MHMIAMALVAALVLTEVTPSGNPFELLDENGVVGPSSRIRIEHRPELAELSALLLHAETTRVAHPEERGYEALLLELAMALNDPRDPGDLLERLRKAQLALPRPDYRLRLSAHARSGDDLRSLPITGATSEGEGLLAGPALRRARLLAVLKANGASLEQAARWPAEARARLSVLVPQGDTVVEAWAPPLCYLDLAPVSQRDVLVRLSVLRDGQPIALLAERGLRLSPQALHVDLKGGVNAIASPVSTGGYSFAPALTFALKWGLRTGTSLPNRELALRNERLRGLWNGFVVSWNEVLDPGLGLNLTTPRLGAGTAPELGIGLSLTLLHDLVQAGRGYDFMTGQDYYFGALSVPWSLGSL
jgi:hypothetical protein